MADVKALVRPSGQVRDTLNTDKLLIGGIDYGIAGGTLTIGTVNATALSIGSVGVVATVLGDLSVNGIFTIVDGGSMIGDGDITLGGGDGDTITLGGSWVSADDIVNIGTVNGIHNTTVNLRCSMGVGQDKRINFDRTADSEGAILLPDTKDAPVALVMGMIRVNAAGFFEWYNGAAWVTAVTTAYTLDDAYNASAGASTISVDAGDVTWNLTGAFSHVTNLAGCTGAADGFFVEDGTDYFRLGHKAADTLVATAQLSSFQIDSSNDISLDSVVSSNFTISANSAGAAVLTLRCNQAGAGTGDISVYAADDTSVRAVAGTLTLRGMGPALGTGVEIDADVGGGAILIGCNAGTNQASFGGAGARNVYVGSTSATGLTMQAEQIAVGISVNTAGAHQIALSAINIGAGTATIALTADDAVTIDSTAAGVSLDAVTASNFTVSGAALTLSGVGLDLNSTGVVTMDASAANSISIGCDANTGAISIGDSHSARSVTIGSVDTTSVLKLQAGTGMISFTDGYKIAGGYAGAFYLALNAAEYTTYEANFCEVSLLNALNQCASTAVTLDEAYNASGGASTITVDAGTVSWNLSGGFGFDVTGGPINLGAGADTYGINIGTGAAARVITIGNVTGVTGVAINTGTGDFAVNTDQLYVDQPTGSVGIHGVTGPTAYLHLGAGTAAASTAPFKFTTGVLNTVAEAGAFEYDGSYLYYTDTTPTRHMLAIEGEEGIQVLNAATLAFNDFNISTIFVSYTATGACTITIDSDQIAIAGRKFTIKDSGLNAAANNITLATEGAETIEGEVDLIMNADGMSITLQSDGTNLWIV